MSWLIIIETPERGYDDCDSSHVNRAYGPFQRWEDAWNASSEYHLPELGGCHWAIVPLRRPAMLKTDTGADHEREVTP